jgi:gluconokinase
MEAAGASSALVVVVIGVSGSGKSSVGELLAQRLAVPFVDGDDVHPAANIAKMAAGHPLDDADRRPWLAVLAARIRIMASGGESSGGDVGGVVVCSALKRVYRDQLREGSPGVWFLHLVLEKELAVERVAARIGHFMPTQLLDSQYALLEPLEPDEPGMTVDVSADLRTILEEALAGIRAVEGA